jgi:hypothetical protein
MTFIAAFRGAAQTPVRDPQALMVASQAVGALAPTVSLNDVALQGTVAYTAGSDEETGVITLEARGNGQSRMVLNLPGGQRQEIRNGPTGVWIGPDGEPHAMAIHNCWTDAPWFFPALSLQALFRDAEVSVLYAGLETREGVALQHLRLFRTVPGQTPEITADIQRLSAVDLYLDPTSYLPLVLSFRIHADDDLNVDIPVEIQFAEYRPVNGVNVPFRIRKFLQGSLMLDITLSGAATNTGLPDSVFAMQVE